MRPQAARSPCATPWCRRSRATRRPIRCSCLAGGPGQAATRVVGRSMPLFRQLNATGATSCSSTSAAPAAPTRSMRDACRRRRRLRATFDIGFLRRACAECLRGAEIRPGAVRDLDRPARPRRGARGLGAPQVNLWGASYGTRAALEYLRQFPQHVRTVVLDGVAPPDMALPASIAIDADAALETCWRMRGRCRVPPAPSDSGRRPEGAARARCQGRTAPRRRASADRSA